MSAELVEQLIEPNLTISQRCQALEEILEDIHCQIEARDLEGKKAKETNSQKSYDLNDAKEWHKVGLYQALCHLVAISEVQQKVSTPFAVNVNSESTNPFCESFEEEKISGGDALFTFMELCGEIITTLANAYSPLVIQHVLGIIQGILTVKKTSFAMPHPSRSVANSPAGSRSGLKNQKSASDVSTGKKRVSINSRAGFFSGAPKMYPVQPEGIAHLILFMSTFADKAQPHVQSELVAFLLAYFRTTLSSERSGVGPHIFGTSVLQVASSNLTLLAMVSSALGEGKENDTPGNSVSQSFTVRRRSRKSSMFGSRTSQTSIPKLTLYQQPLYEKTEKGLRKRTSIDIDVSGPAGTQGERYLLLAAGGAQGPTPRQKKNAAVSEIPAPVKAVITCGHKVGQLYATIDAKTLLAMKSEHSALASAINKDNLADEPDIIVTQPVEENEQPFAAFSSPVEKTLFQIVRQEYENMDEVSDMIYRAAKMVLKIIVFLSESNSIHSPKLLTDEHSDELKQEGSVFNLALTDQLTMLLAHELCATLDKRDYEFTQNLCLNLERFSLQSDAALFHLFRQPLSIVGYPIDTNQIQELRIPQDLFLKHWTVVTTYLFSLNPTPWDQIVPYLCALAMYIVKARGSSRSLLLQSATICFPLVATMFEKYRETVAFTPTFATGLHYFLEICCAVMSCPNAPPVLLQVIVQLFLPYFPSHSGGTMRNPPLALFLREYTRRLLTADPWRLFDIRRPQKGRYSDLTGESTMFFPNQFDLTLHLIRLIRHYKSLLELPLYSTSSLVPPQTKIFSSRRFALRITSELIIDHCLDFLLNPFEGVVLSVLSSNPLESLSVPLTIETLEFFRIVAQVAHPCISRNQWNATYIRFLYLSFLITYNSEDFAEESPAALRITCLTLRALGDLVSVDHLARIKSRQLGIVSTLVREVELEQSVKDLREKHLRRSTVASNYPPERTLSIATIKSESGDEELGEHRRKPSGLHRLSAISDSGPPTPSKQAAMTLIQSPSLSGQLSPQNPSGSARKLGAAPPIGKSPFLMIPKLSLAKAPPPMYYTSNGDTAGAADFALAQNSPSVSFPKNVTPTTEMEAKKFPSADPTPPDDVEPEEKSYLDEDLISQSDEGEKGKEDETEPEGVESEASGPFSVSLHIPTNLDNTTRSNLFDVHAKIPEMLKNESDQFLVSMDAPPSLSPNQHTPGSFPAEGPEVPPVNLGSSLKSPTVSHLKAKTSLTPTPRSPKSVGFLEGIEPAEPTTKKQDELLIPRLTLSNAPPPAFYTSTGEQTYDQSEKGGRSSITATAFRTPSLGITSVGTSEQEDYSARRRSLRKGGSFVDQATYPVALVQNEGRFIAHQRSKRRVYVNQDVQAEILFLLMTLIVKNNGTLDAQYLDSYTFCSKKVNILFYIEMHLNHSLNKNVLGPLATRVFQSTNRGLHVLFRLLSARPELFATRYMMKHRIGGGAYGTVVSCHLKLPNLSNSNKSSSPQVCSPFGSFAKRRGVTTMTPDLQGSDGQTFPKVSEPQSSSCVIAMKAIPVPRHIDDRAHIVSLHTEILVMIQNQDLCGMCEVLDFGNDGNSYRIIMKQYSKSLRKWREELHREQRNSAEKAFPSSTENRQLQQNNFIVNLNHKLLPTYIAIFMDILDAVDSLHKRNIVHYDLKCDNVLLQSEPEADGKHLVQFRIGDFGEAEVLYKDDGASPVSNRKSSATRPGQDTNVENTIAKGTEFTRAPECLLPHKFSKGSMGFQSDVWSLGCLLFELITGMYLFEEEAYGKLVQRVTSEKGNILEERHEQLLDNDKNLIQLFIFILNRNPQERPSLADVREKIVMFMEEQKLILPHPSIIDIEAISTLQSKLEGDAENNSRFTAEDVLVAPFPTLPIFTHQDVCAANEQWQSENCAYQSSGYESSLHVGADSNYGILAQHTFPIIPHVIILSGVNQRTPDLLDQLYRLEATHVISFGYLPNVEAHFQYLNLGNVLNCFVGEMDSKDSTLNEGQQNQSAKSNFVAGNTFVTYAIPFIQSSLVLNGRCILIGFPLAMANDATDSCFSPAEFSFSWASTSGKFDSESTSNIDLAVLLSLLYITVTYGIPLVTAATHLDMYANSLIADINMLKCIASARQLLLSVRQLPVQTENQQENEGPISQKLKASFAPYGDFLTQIQPPIVRVMLWSDVAAQYDENVSALNAIQFNKRSILLQLLQKQEKIYRSIKKHQQQMKSAVGTEVFRPNLYQCLCGQIVYELEPHDDIDLIATGDITEIVFNRQQQSWKVESIGHRNIDINMLRDYFIFLTETYSPGLTEKVFPENHIRVAQVTKSGQNSGKLLPPLNLIRLEALERCSLILGTPLVKNAEVHGSHYQQARGTGGGIILKGNQWQCCHCHFPTHWISVDHSSHLVHCALPIQLGHIEAGNGKPRQRVVSQDLRPTSWFARFHLRPTQVSVSEEEKIRK